ncbi:MAG: DUF2459 domain-containing protein [Anaerolineae bacterium]
MQAVKLLWKILLRTFAFCCLALTTYFGLGHILGIQIVNTDFEPDPNGIQIYILSNGVHTDIAVPTVTAQKDWTIFLDPATFQPPVPAGTIPTYIAFGWGDKTLYEDVPNWSDLTLPIAAKAMLIPSESAMHISYFIDKPKATVNSIPIKISVAQYQILVNAFVESFELVDGTPQSLNCCFYPHLRDQFYASNRNYHALFTCNMWTNKVLKSAGIPTARWAPQERYIMDPLKEIDLK